MVATCPITLATGLLGQMPSFADPPLWSLNAPYANHRRFRGKENPL